MLGEGGWEKCSIEGRRGLKLLDRLPCRLPSTLTFRNNAAFGSGVAPVHGGDRGSGGALYSIDSGVGLRMYVRMVDWSRCRARCRLIPHVDGCMWVAGTCPSFNFENNVAAAFGGGMYIRRAFPREVALNR